MVNQPLAAPSASLVVAAQSTGPARLAAPGLRQLLWMPWLRAKQSFGISYNFCAHLIFETGNKMKATQESLGGLPERLALYVDHRCRKQQLRSIEASHVQWMNGKDNACTCHRRQVTIAFLPTCSRTALRPWPPWQAKVTAQDLAHSTTAQLHVE